MSEYCVIFCRVSTEQQAKEGLSLDAQQSFLERYAKEHDFIPLEVFRVDESGSKAVRKRFNEMLNWMRENEVKILLVEKHDRYSRQSTEDFVESLKRVCSEYGIDQIHFPKESQIWDSKKGWTAGEKLQARVMSAVATYKSDIISDEVKKVFAQMLERGEPPYTPPLGYRSIPKDKKKGRPRMIVQTDQAEKVKQLLEIFNAKRLTLSQALKIANDIGLRSSRGNKLLVKEDIARIVKERFYFGEFMCKGEIYKLKVPGYEPLISKHVWEENQEILKQRKKYRKPDGDKKKFRFNQLIHCGQCGRLLFGIQPVYHVKWKKRDGSVAKKDYKYPTKYGCTSGHWYTVDGTVPIPKEYIDEDTMKVKKDITYDGDYYFDKKKKDWKIEKKTWLKKGHKVQKLKCQMPWFMETEVERILLDNIDLIKFSKKNWNALKSKLFKDETKEFLDFEIQSLRSEQSKNETRMEKLYNDYDKGVITGDFTKKQQDKIEARQQEIRIRLNELEDERRLYDEKIGRSIQIIDNLKGWKEKWEAASDDKKNEMLRLMTVKISTFRHKDTIDGKDYDWKDIQIVWNEEFNDLFELGIFEQDKKQGARIPGYGGSLFQFNSQKIRDG